MLAELPDVWAGGPRPAARAGARCPTPASATCSGRRSLGAWPASRERLHAYAEKAMREAGDRTTWTDAGRGLRGGRARRRRRGVRRRRGARGARRPASARVAGPGWSNALAAKLRRADDAGRARRLPGQRAVGAVPGRPRQPAAGRLRRTREVLAGCSPASARAHRRRRRPGHAKLLVTAGRADACAATGRSCSRRTRPVPAAGEAADHVLAFDRGGAVTVATRLPVGLAAAAAGATPC